MCGQQLLERDLARARLARETVAFAFDVPADEIAAPTRRSSEVAFARQVAMYLAHVAFELNLARVGLAFGRDRSTAAHACQIVEDRRDDPAFDAWLDGLEDCLRTAPEPERTGQAA
ncbi:helix-turn-helix domain-containing protein [Hyphobacterium sp.]|uniref:helix-turn-helix domain-containing protein n=1 Tax=Hyphobacterium sp. TaxID=2004662 RepID=UPI003BA9EBDB